MNAQFTVQTDSFNGPLDVLLDLIEKRKLFVSDISLAEVADDFVHYLERNRNLPVAETAQFLLIASTLLLIKSRSLLPNLSLTCEEEADIEDLEKRLRLYKKIKESSEMLAQKWAVEPLLSPKKKPIKPVVFVPSEDITIENIASAAKDLLASFPSFVTNPQVNVKKVTSLPDMIDKLALRVQRAVKTRFSTIAEKEDKVEYIVSFLALLELVRGGLASVNQDKRFAEIDIEIAQSNSISVPTY